MFIVLTIIFFVLMIAILRYDPDGPLAMPAVGAFIVALVALVFCVGMLVNSRVVDEKIMLCEEENSKIEEQLNALIEQYMNYESDTYKSVKGESMISRISLYPELKTDSLVEKQIEVYVENNKTIRQLKNEKINVSNYKFWIYFGR